MIEDSAISVEVKPPVIGTSLAEVIAFFGSEFFTTTCKPRDFALLPLRTMEILFRYCMLPFGNPTLLAIATFWYGFLEPRSWGPWLSSILSRHLSRNSPPKELSLFRYFVDIEVPDADIRSVAAKLNKPFQVIKSMVSSSKNLGPEKKLYLQAVPLLPHFNYLDLTASKSSGAKKNLLIAFFDCSSDVMSWRVGWCLYKSLRLGFVLFKRFLFSLRISEISSNSSDIFWVKSLDGDEMNPPFIFNRLYDVLRIKQLNTRTLYAPLDILTSVPGQKEFF